MHLKPRAVRRALCGGHAMALSVPSVARADKDVDRHGGGGSLRGPRAEAEAEDHNCKHMPNLPTPAER